MSGTKRLATAAAMTAIAAAAIAASRFLPFFSLTPLLVCSVCFYIGLECGWRFGLLGIAATLILGFFIAGLSSAFLLCALIFAPYSILARLIKRLEYKSIKQALIRLALAALLFNAMLAILVFALGSFVDQLIFSYTLAQILNSGMGYVILALLGTAFMAGFDFIFAGICKIILSKYIKIGGDNDKRLS